MRLDVCTLLLLVACSEPVSATHVAAVTGGTVDSEHDAVVKLMQNGVFHCSGTLIAPRAVLTAAHCLTDEASYSVVTDLGSVDVEAVVRHPQFQPTGTAFDIGIVILRQTVDITPLSPVAFRGAGDADLQGLLELVGYGQDEAGGAGLLRRSGTVIVTSYRDADFVTDAAPSQSCFGDSGGPLLAAVSGTQQVAGVVSTSANGCMSTGTATRVGYYYESFVAPILAAIEGETRGIGERCYWDGQCTSGQCLATDVFGLAVCTAACRADAECGGGTCGVGGLCSADVSRFALGAPCDADDQCATNVCNVGLCTQPCAQISAASCPVGFACVASGDAAECRPEADGAGCRVTHVSSFWLVTALFGLTRKRRRRVRLPPAGTRRSRVVAVVLLGVGCQDAPLTQQREQDSVFDLGDFIAACFAGNPPARMRRSDYWDYGCYCGKGGAGTAVDATDECCKAHDECWAKVKQNTSVSCFNESYANNYNDPATGQATTDCSKWTFAESCSRAEHPTNDTPEEEACCKCDLEVAQCFQRARGSYDLGYKDWSDNGNPGATCGPTRGKSYKCQSGYIRRGEPCIDGTKRGNRRIGYWCEATCTKPQTCQTSKTRGNSYARCADPPPADEQCTTTLSPDTDNPDLLALVDSSSCVAAECDEWPNYSDESCTGNHEPDLGELVEEWPVDDTQLPDAGVPDAGVPDAGGSDAGVVDAFTLGSASW